MYKPSRPFPRIERGTTLIIAIVLLLVMALIGLFAATVGLREQQASGAELRERIVRQTAEAGLSHAIEYARGASFVPAQVGGEVNVALWEPCLAADNSFPCGLAEPSRRGAMYRYRGGVDVDGNGSVDNREKYMVPLPTDAAGSRQVMTKVGNFNVQYGVAAVLCTLDFTGTCTRKDEDRTGLGAVTLASWAQIPGEETRITITETYGSFRILNIPPSAPPLVAGGLMQGVGNATVVANPNSGGPGVPVSLWARGPIDANNGSWQTCQLDEYVRLGQPKYEGDTRVLTCDDRNCACALADKVSRKGLLGIDVQSPLAPPNDADKDGDGQPDYWSPDILPSQYFPCDMFEYVFGIRARENTNGIMTHGARAPYPICEDGKDADGDGHIDVAYKFLNSNAKKIVDTCAPLDTKSAGLIWVKGACSLDHPIGSPDDPVVIVATGSGGEIGMGTDGRVFGVVFGFDTKLIDLDETNFDNNRPALGPGGGSGKVYGSVMVEGGVKANARIDLVATPKVIDNFNQNRRNFKYGVVPGSWSDRFGY